jgi:acyl-coenzyme A thioesterase PaaI-like protein
MPRDDFGTPTRSYATTHRREAREDTMGKLVVTEFVTLDGVAQAPGAPDEDRDGGFAHGGWQAPLLDEASGDVMFEQASDMDALLPRTQDL